MEGARARLCAWPFKHVSLRSLNIDKITGHDNK